MKRNSNRKNRKWLVFFITAAVLILAASFFLNRGYHYFMEQAYPIRYESIVVKEAADNKLEPALVYSVIKAESNFRADAVSHAGAVGLMQLTPETFDWLQTKQKGDRVYTAEDLKSPEINIRYGCKFLSILLEKYPVTSTSLCAYNAGIGTVNNWLKDSALSKDGKTLDQIPYSETKNYVNAVLKNYKQYKTIYRFNSEGETIDE